MRKQNIGCGEAERVGLGSSFRVFGSGLSTVPAADEGGSIVEGEVFFFFFNIFYISTVSLSLPKS